ncbi:hypothetical protein [uncultured Gammaproteobacteria bacterium]|nr:hypothetical protein [uncultured Gammaproteobacteria bacterium]CAC9598045.1 hypothetical protein [uncultured Gammaproteobacteria bacterium]CAC9598858.1 hypothetical protein [uncultured Gammaproteobacteria bacterium]CAC9608657.1 hypothetical protein [uncultured Gammaproteobacteria bacterium]CAC9970385.1 hypothetical protein [uncultured Gammaproteobacteria bacterium]
MKKSLVTDKQDNNREYKCRTNLCWQYVKKILREIEIVVK